MSAPRIRRLGLFGGSFDPVHHGHVEPVLQALRELDLDRVVYLPTARPPHKPGRQFAPSHARFAMVELALLEHPELLVSAFELTPGKPAFTVDTVRHFRERHPRAELYLLIGGDSFATIDGWHGWRELVDEARLGVLMRPGWRVERVRAELAPAVAELAATDRVHFVANRAVEISSTELRRRFAEGREVGDDLMPGLVVRYVLKYALYR